MSIGQRLTARLKQMCAIHPDVPIDPERALELVGQKLLTAHMEALLCRSGITALLVMVNGVPELPEGEQRFLSDVLGGIAWDFGAMGGEMAHLEQVFDMPKAPTIDQSQSRIVRLH